MSYEIATDEANGLAIVTFHGSATLQDVLDVNDTLAPEGSFVYMRRLWDFRDATIDLTNIEMRQLAIESRKLDPATSAKAAIVTARDVDFGLSRMHEAYRASPEVAERVFRDIDDALRWLGISSSNETGG